MNNSIASCVKQIMESRPYMHEVIDDGIISWANYAEFILPQVEKMTGRKCSKSSIVMAARRYGDAMKAKSSDIRAYRLPYEIVMKTNIIDINLSLNDSLLIKLGQIYPAVSVDKGDFFNVALGTNEISLVVSEKYRELVEKMAEGEKVLTRNNDLVALTLVFSGDFIQTPGIIYKALRFLLMNGVNVIELVTTMNELTFVIKSGDSTKAYDVLRDGF